MAPSLAPGTRFLLSSMTGMSYPSLALLVPEESSTPARHASRARRLSFASSTFAIFAPETIARRCGDRSSLIWMEDPPRDTRDERMPRPTMGRGSGCKTRGTRHGSKASSVTGYASRGFLMCEDLHAPDALAGEVKRSPARVGHLVIGRPL